MGQPDVYADDHHWGDAVVDIDARDLPALKARYLVERLPERGRVVEIGCGGGRLLNTVAAHRPALELHGCDIRPLDTKPKHFTFTLVDSDDAALPYDAGSLDAVVLFDVLEHLTDPGATLRAARAVLRPGGRLISFTPLEGRRLSFYRLYRRIFGNDLYVETKEHLQAFSEGDLRRLVAEEFVLREPEYLYHFLGQLMDATLFALLKIPALRKRFWEDNPFYAESSAAATSTESPLGFALRAANSVAYTESRLLRRSSFAAAGILFTATVRGDSPPAR